jgi:hypothetical protein
MAVKIGHARYGESGITNQTPGDSTGREVCIGTWYSMDSNKSYVARPKSRTFAEKQAQACEAGCKNDRIGYDQTNRNTAYTEAKKVSYDLSKIKTNCETDCSAFMILCAIAAGVTKLGYTGNAPTTSTMRSNLERTGKYEILTDKKYLTSSDYLLRGDIVVKPGSHTFMVLSDGAKTTSEKQDSVVPTYTVGKNYITQVELVVRKGPGTSYSKKSKSELTANAQKYANSTGTLKSGTVVTCKCVKQVDSDIWMRIPSGWVAAYYNEKIYVK